MNPVCNTKRLLLYPMTEKFQKELDLLHADPIVMDLLGGPYSEEKSHIKIKESEAHWQSHGFGLWCWFDKQTKQLIGRGGLRHQQLDNGQNLIEIAYMVHRRFWRQGYTIEVVEYCFEIAFKKMKINEIVFLTTPVNIPSQKVVTKLGLNFEKDLVLFRGLPHLIAKKCDK